MAGPYENLEVVARWKSGRTFFVCVKCHICADDAELNGDALYEMREHKYLTGQKPCECSRAPRRSKEQYEVLLRRALELDGFSFVGWTSKEYTTSGRVLIKCPSHGVLEPKSVNDVLTGRRCIECRRELVAEIRTRSDYDLNKQYIEDSVYAEGSRIERDKSCSKSFIFTCGSCGEICYNLTDGSFRKRTIPCSCNSLSNRRYSYIFEIYDNGSPIALKFGVTSNPWARIHKQRKESGLIVKFVGIWKYDNYNQCLFAEKEVSKQVVTGALNKQQYPDGYTETTDVKNLSTICAIFENCGGIRLPNGGKQ